MESLGNSEFSQKLENGCSDGNGYDMDVGLIQDKPVGAIIEATKPKNIPKLFTPFTIRDQTFPNRIMVIHLAIVNPDHIEDQRSFHNLGITNVHVLV